MQYVFLIYESEALANARSPSEREEEFGRYFAFTDLLRSRNALLGGDALHETASATTVRLRDGQMLTTDGPFAETKEQLGGFYLVDCANLDEAIELAAKIPAAETGCIEVRPVLTFGDMGGTG